MTKTVKTILLPVILLWLIVVVTGYYWGHQYILIPPVISLVRTLVLLFVCLLILLSCLGLGSLLSRLLALDYLGVGETFIFSVGLGACAWALIIIGLGVLGWLNSAAFWTLTLAGSGAALVGLWRHHRSEPIRLNFQLRGLERIDYFFLFFIFLVLILGTQLALAPPIGWDGLTTHLVFVRDILAQGKLEPVAISTGRITGHLLYVWGMALGGDILPQMMSYGMGLLIISAVANFTHRHFGLRTAVLATAILVSVEVFVLTAGWPYLDVPTAFFALLAVLSLIRWQLAESRSRSWLLLAAIFAVFAGHTKLNGLFVYPVVLFGFLLGLVWNRSEWKPRLIDGAIALAAALILTLIWSAAEATVVADESGLIDILPDQAASITNQALTYDSFKERLSTYVKVLWEMTIIGQQGAVIYDGTISPLFLILLPILLFLRHKPRVVISLISAAVIEFAAWMIFPKGYYQNRHLILAYPIFSILTAYIIYRLDEFDFVWFSLSGFLRLLLLLVFSLQIFSLLVWWQSINPLSYLLGLKSRDQYLADNLNGGTSPGYYDMMKFVEDELPDDSVVGIIWPEPRLYYCPENCVRYPFADAADVDAMLSAAQANGLTHVVVSEKGMDYWLDFYRDDDSRKESRERFRSELAKFTGQFGVLVNEQEESFYLYRLRLEPVSG